MNKKNGFVFMETIVVLSVLSITLILLFSSYSYILKKARVRKTFDTTEMIYANFNVKEYIEENYDTLDKFFNESSNRIYSYPSSSSDKYFVCNVAEEAKTNENLKRLNEIFDVEKMYILNPYKIITESESVENVRNRIINKFDATTIDYINSLGKGINRNIFIVKYKKLYTDGTYEIFHAYMEVD